MKVLAVARKGLIELLREPQLLALSFLAPLLFLVATIASYGRPFLVTHPVVVVDAAPGGAALIDDLAALRYPDGRPALAITRSSDPRAAEAALERRKFTLFLLLTPGEDGAPLAVTLRGDALDGRYYEASSLVNGALRRHLGRLSGRADVVRMVETPLHMGAGSGAPLRGPQRESDLFVPGMIIFAILLLVPQTAMLLGREVRAGTLERLRLSPLSTGDMLLGVSLAQMAVAALQVVVVFGAAQAMGFTNQGAPGLVLLLGLAVSFSAIGQGLIVACFVANDSQAINYGSVVTMLQVFVSGAFFPMPAPVLLTLAGHELTLFDVVPATQGMLLLQQVTSYGATWGEITFRLALLVGLSLLSFALGVLVFARLQMRRP